jgi:hypothetical protein
LNLSKALLQDQEREIPVPHHKLTAGELAQTALQPERELNALSSISQHEKALK